MSLDLWGKGSWLNDAFSLFLLENLAEKERRKGEETVQYRWRRKPARDCTSVPHALHCSPNQARSFTRAPRRLAVSCLDVVGLLYLGSVTEGGGGEQFTVVPGTSHKKPRTQPYMTRLLLVAAVA